jgi:hypothetical protein
MKISEMMEKNVKEYFIVVYREINFDSIVLGTLISADCGGLVSKQCN